MVPQHVQPPGPRAEHHESLAARGRRDLVRDQLHHVLHPHGLGQRTGQGQHLRNGDQPGGGVAGLRPGPVHLRHRPRPRDPHTEPGRTGIHPERQPVPGRPDRHERGGVLAEQRGPVAVLVHRVVQPGHRRPQLSAQQFADREPDQLGRGRVGEADPPVQIERAQPVRQPCHHPCRLHRAERAGRAAHRRYAEQIGFVQRRKTVLQCALQPDGEPVAGRGQMVPLPVGQLGRMGAGPGHEDRAVRRRLRRHRHRGQCEGVRQHDGDARIAARHLLLATHPHQPPRTHGVGDRDGRAESHPLPRRGEGPGQPRHHGHLQDRFAGRQQIHRAGVRVDVVHHRRQRKGQQRTAHSRPRGRRSLRGRLPVGHADHLLARPGDGFQGLNLPLGGPSRMASGEATSHPARKNGRSTTPGTVKNRRLPLRPRTMPPQSMRRVVHGLTGVRPHAPHWPDPRAPGRSRTLRMGTRSPPIRRADGKLRGGQ